MLTRRRVDFCCVQKVRFKGQGARCVGEKKRHKLWWSGGKESRNGDGVRFMSIFIHAQSCMIEFFPSNYLKTLVFDKR